MFFFFKSLELVKNILVVQDKIFTYFTIHCKTFCFCKIYIEASQHVYLPAVDNGAYYIDESGNGLQLITKDAPLVVIGTKTKHPSPFPVPLEPITVDDIKGIGFNIYNNIWNTNYVLWYPYDENDYDKSIQTRYSIDFMVR